MGLNINFLAVLASALGAFLLGGLWYSPLMFLNVWKRHAGIEGKETHSTFTYLGALVLYLISAFAFALFLGPHPTLLLSVIIGLLTGFAFAATSFGINYAFAGRSFKLFLIDGGYHTLQFGLYGLILGAWH